MLTLRKNNALDSLRLILLIGVIVTSCLLPLTGCKGPIVFQTKTTTTQSPIYSITITSPHNGDNWQVGSTVTITWTIIPNIPASSPVSVYLEKGSPMLGEQIGITTNTGSFSWVVTNTFIGTQMRIDIEVPACNSGTLSAGYFTISPQ